MTDYNMVASRKEQTLQLFNVKFLRVCACLGVVLVHLGQRIELTGKLRTFTGGGGTGVLFFFFFWGILGF